MIRFLLTRILTRILSQVIYRIEVSKKGTDPQVEGLARLMAEEGLPSKGLSIIKVYFIKSAIERSVMEEIARELFADPVSEVISFGRTQPAGARALEVWYHPGVTDPESNWIYNHLKSRKIDVEDVRRATKFLFPASVPRAKLARFAERHLFNPLIQHLTVRGEEPFPKHGGVRSKIEEIKLDGLSDSELLELSSKRDWHFSLEEIKAICSHFSKIGRDPTLVEMETLAQTWSEHCVHKTLRASYEVNGERFSNLLKETIMQPSLDLGLDWCLSLFTDNAGVVQFSKDWALAFKVETHNHPSAIEPYGGAATGIGGVIRDALGTGQGADPILNTDVFCFGPPGFPSRKLPKGVLPPRTVLEGVVHGVRDYGNRMGIPTASGALYFDELYLANPLVYCGTLGILPLTRVEKKVSPGDRIVLAGARTGRDGVHGVTFASTSLAGSSHTKHGSAVQIGNPIEEKLLRDFVIAARDRGLVASITDCGGGGLSSAVGEQTAEHGCVLDLDKVPLKYAGLAPHEIWISESQERMVVFVRPENMSELMLLADQIGVEATDIGEVSKDKTLRLRYRSQDAAALEMNFLHKGLPRKNFRIAPMRNRAPKESEIPPPRDVGQALLRLLGQLNVASKEWVIRQYDHEVKGATVLKPLTGLRQDAPSDAIVIQPFLDDAAGIAVSQGLAPRYALLDAYASAAAAIDEAIRNLVVAGGRVDRIALLDNFCAGDASDEKILNEIVQAALACRDAINVYRIPFISGKDSLNNFFADKDKSEKINIPTTLLVSGLTLVRDVTKTVSSDFKHPKSKVYILGSTALELGGSEYCRMHMKMGERVPRVDMKAARRRYRKLERAIRSGFVSAAHDLADGGLGVALAEMCLGGDIGVKVNLSSIPLSEPLERLDYMLFSETQSRILLEVKEGNSQEFEAAMEGEVFACIGETTADQRLVFDEEARRTVATVSISEIRAAWTQGLPRFLD